MANIGIFVLLTVILCISASETNVEIWGHAIRSGDRETVFSQTKYLKDLIKDATERDTKLRMVEKKLTSVFDPALDSGKDAADVDWKQLLDDVTSQERDIDATTPAKQAMEWLRLRKRETPASSEAIVALKNVKDDVEDNLIRMQYMISAFRYLKAVDPQTRGPSQTLRLAGIYYRESRGGLSIVDTYENASVILKDALTNARVFEALFAKGHSSVV